MFFDDAGAVAVPAALQKQSRYDIGGKEKGTCMNKKIRLFSIICLSALLLALFIFAGCAEKQKQNGETPQDPAGTETVCEHSWVTISETQPTCTDRGHREQVCVLCGETEETSFGAALGHDYGDWVTERIATCGESGLNTRTCSRCGRKEQEVLFVQHHYERGKTFTPAADECLVQGYTEYVCSECGDTYRIYTDIAGHTPSAGSAKTVEPTCTVGGYTEYTCSKCGETYIDDETEALGHDYQARETVEPTCSCIGGAAEECSRCGNRKYIDVQPKLPHIFDSKGCCEKCGKYVVDAVILEGATENAFVLGDDKYGYIVYAPDASASHDVMISRSVIDTLVAQGYHTLNLSFGSPDLYYRMFRCQIVGSAISFDVNCFAGQSFAYNKLTVQIADEQGNIADMITERGLLLRMQYHDASGDGYADRGSGSLENYALKIDFVRSFIESERDTWLEGGNGIEAVEDNASEWIISLTEGQPATPVLVRPGAVSYFAEQGAASLRFVFTSKEGQKATFSVNGVAGNSNVPYTTDIIITNEMVSEGIIFNLALGKFEGFTPDGLSVKITVAAYNFNENDRSTWFTSNVSMDIGDNGGWVVTAKTSDACRFVFQAEAIEYLLDEYAEQHGDSDMLRFTFTSKVGQRTMFNVNGKAENGSCSVDVEVTSDMLENGFSLLVYFNTMPGTGLASSDGFCIAVEPVAGGGGGQT